MYATVPANGRYAQVALVVASAAALVLRHGVQLDVALSGVPAQLDGPLPPARRKATLVVSVAGREALRVPLVHARRGAGAGRADRTDRSAAAGFLWRRSGVLWGVACAMRRCEGVRP